MSHIYTKAEPTPWDTARLDFAIRWHWWRQQAVPT